MIKAISKTSSGTVKLEYTDSNVLEYLGSLQNMKIQAVFIGVTKQPNIYITFSGNAVNIPFNTLESINGEAVPEDIFAAITLIATTVFNFGGGSGNGAVESVTGNIVTGTDTNPVIDFPIGDNRQVPVYKDGEIVAQRLGWAQFSDLPTPPPFSNGFLTGTAFKEDGSALYGFIEWALGEQNQSVVKPNAVPAYNPGIIGNGGGTIPVANAIENADAVNLGQLTLRVPAPPTSGTFTLKSVNGVTSWVAS